MTSLENAFFNAKIVLMAIDRVSKVRRNLNMDRWMDRGYDDLVK